MRWGTRVLVHEVVGEKRHRLVVGRGRADVALPLRGTLEVVKGPEGGELYFSSGLVGELVEGRGTRRFATLIDEGVAEEAGDERWRLRLSSAQSVSCAAGRLAVTVRPVTLSQQVRARLDDVLDYRWLNVLLVCLFVASVAIAEASFQEPAAPSDSDVPLRYLVRTSFTPLERPVAIRKQVEETGPAAPTPPSRPRVPTTRPAPTPGAGPAVLSVFAGQGLVVPGLGLSAALKAGVGSLARVGEGTTGDGLSGLRLRGRGHDSLGGELVRIGGVGVGTRARPGAGGDGLCRGSQCAGAVEPHLEPGPTVTCGGQVACMDKELIRKVIREHVGQLRYCYESLLSRFPSLEGRVVVTFHVGDGGHVDRSAVVSSSAGAELGECVASRARTWVFPTNRGVGGYVVTYPFLFRASGT